MIIIKKEKDSKYYDSSLKKYINLKEILAYYESGAVIKVIDCSNREITEKVVLQAIIKHKETTYLKELIKG